MTNLDPDSPLWWISEGLKLVVLLAAFAAFWIGIDLMMTMEP